VRESPLLLERPKITAEQKLLGLSREGIGFFVSLLMVPVLAWLIRTRCCEFLSCCGIEMAMKMVAMVLEMLFASWLFAVRVCVLLTKV